jgi:hypothetical protein
LGGEARFTITKVPFIDKSLEYFPKTIYLLKREMKGNIRTTEISFLFLSVRVWKVENILRNFPTLVLLYVHVYLYYSTRRKRTDLLQNSNKNSYPNCILCQSQNRTSIRRRSPCDISHRVYTLDGIVEYSFLPFNVSGFFPKWNTFPICNIDREHALEI